MQMNLIFIRAQTIMPALSGVALYAWAVLRESSRGSPNASAVNKYEFLPLCKI